MSQRSVLLLLSVGLCVSFASCGGDSPSSTTPVAQATPTPTPSPSPTATPTPTALSCKLPAMKECAAAEGPKGVFGCCRQSVDVLGEYVLQAIRQVQAERPELFDRDYIKDPSNNDLVVQLVAKTLEQKYGLCAKAGSPNEDEVAVKNSNDFSEQYDIILGAANAVNAYGYTVTCKPARF